MVKRPLDVALGLLGLALAAPLLAVAAIGIRLSSPGPVFYRARRVGRNGAGFTMYKLRTMHPHAGAASAITGRNDPRVFPVGAWLRRTKIDELPQLFNVLRGDMSLVGPRPALRWEVELYQHHHHHERFLVRPGITGLWQVSGRSRLTMTQALDLDVEYARRRSVLFDLWILIRTVPAVLPFGAAR